MSEYRCCDHCNLHTDAFRGHSVPCYQCAIGAEQISAPREQAASGTEPAARPEMPPFPQRASEAYLAASMRYVMETYGTKATIKRLTVERDDARAEIGRLKCEVWALKSALSLGNGLRDNALDLATKTVLARDDEVERLTAEAEDQHAAYGFLEVEVAEQIAKVAERDATIERLWAQLCDGQLVEEAASRARHPAGKDLPPTEITHGTPCCGRQTTPCCDKSPFELPRSDRMTLDPSMVTCIQAAFDRRAQ